jgi:RNA polymerase sigma factor (sigma-70 family)
MNLQEAVVKNDVDAILEKARRISECKLRAKGFVPAHTSFEDVVQEVLIHVYQTIEKYDSSRAAFSTFLDHIIYTKIEKCYRKGLNLNNKMFYGAMDLDLLDKETVFKFYSTEDSYSLDDSCKLSFNNVETKTQLTPKEWEVLKLLARGFNQVEISKSMSTSKARVSQIVANLKLKVVNKN